MIKFSKEEAKSRIKNFFFKVEDKSSKDVKKIKRLAMKNNLQLKEKRKLFCKKCLAPYKNPKIRIKNRIKNITCEYCKHTSRWKIK